jgi:hypothetical protein
MSASEAKKRPKPKRYKRPTCLTLDPRIWDRLKQIESETDARPSATANRMLLECLKLEPAREA